LTSPPASPRSPRSATPGSSTPASSAAPPLSSAPRSTTPACAPPRATSASRSPSTRTCGRPPSRTPTSSATSTSSIRSSGRARLARRAGLDFGYHNHQAEFLRQNGTDKTGYDILTGETDPRLVHLEVDLFWAYRGARDPVDLIERLRGRIKQVHVKDLDIQGSFADPGAGLIDFGRIFARSREAGLVEYIVERDDAGTPPRTPADALTTARVGYDYLAGVRF
jgi:sugar phosphate isomerase/epimerase